MKGKKLAALALSSILAVTSFQMVPVMAENEEEVTLRVASVYVDGHSMNKVFEEVLSNFEEEHPNVKISREFMPSEQLQAKLKTDAASNNLPDIFPVWELSTNVDSVKAGLWEDLSDELEADTEWKDSFNSGTLDGFQYEEAPGQWAVPLCSYGIGFYYNKEVFEEAGAEVPTTWTELLDVIAKLKDAGYTPWELGAKEAWRCEHLFTCLYYKMYGIDQASKLTDGSLTYDDPSFTETFNKMLELVDAGAFNPNMIGIDYATEVANFASGKVGMQLNGAWAIGETDGPDTPDTIKGKIGYFPFPNMEMNDEFNGQWFGGVNDAFAMKSGLEGATKEAALELMKDITSVETAKKIGEESGNIPSVKVELDQEKSGELMQAVVDAIGNADQMAGDIYGFEPSQEVGTNFSNITQGVMCKQISPEDACKQLMAVKAASGK